MTSDRLRKKGRTVAKFIMTRDQLAAQRVRKINENFDLASKNVIRKVIRRKR